MSVAARKWWLLAAAMLAVASMTALAVLASGEVIPSRLRNPMAEFVEPGVDVWWLILGGPFRSAPSSLVGIAFAALTNATLWLLVLWFVMLIVRVVRRMFAASPS